MLLVAMVGHWALFVCSTNGSEVHPAQCVGDVLDSLLVILWPGLTAANVFSVSSLRIHHILYHGVGEYLILIGCRVSSTP